MKLQPDRSSAPSVTSHGPGWVAVNGERIDAPRGATGHFGCDAWYERAL